MAENPSSLEDQDTCQIAVPKFPIDTEFHRRRLKASLWLAKKRESSKAIIWLLTMAMYLLGGSSAQANPTNPKGQNLLARKSSSRLKLQDILSESSNTHAESDKPSPETSSKAPPKTPEDQNFSIIPKPEVEKKTQEKSPDDITLDYRNLEQDFNWNHEESSGLRDYTIHTEELLPLEKLWDTAGDLLENSVNRADREWRAYRLNNDIREEHYSEAHGEEIDLWRSFQKEVCKFLTPKIRVSGLKIKIINSWENENFRIRIQTSVKPNNGFLHEIKARAEYRTEILEGLFRIIGKYRFRPQDQDSGSLEARFDKSFSEHCSAYISSSVHLNGDQQVEFGFSLNFGGPSRPTTNHERFRQSARLSRGERARSRISPERVFTQVAKKAHSKAEDDEDYASLR